jgi:hypothetical protein
MSVDVRKTTGFLKVIGLLLLILLAPCIGWLAAVMTFAGIEGVSAGQGMAFDEGMIGLSIASICWAIFGLSIWGTVRLARGMERKAPAPDPTP